MTTIRKLVLFGAGNIGRSFIAQVFSRGGYEVVFVDVNDRLIGELNRRGRYRIVIKRLDKPDNMVWVESVRAVNGADTAAVAEELADAAVAATAVGKGALPHVMPSIARGLLLRRERRTGDPLDIIIAENIRDGARYFSGALRKILPDDFDLASRAGFVETSIGKMAPIMKARDVEDDPLQVFAEEYNTLIVDGKGFRGALPDIPDLEPKENIIAWVDRKLFIHNLGHAAAAYFGFCHDPGFVYVYQALAVPGLLERTRACMLQSAAALNRQYPRDLFMDDLVRHIDNLLDRFRNRALEDTIFRVGRDLYRKLDRSDRLTGALLLAKHNGCPCDEITAALQAAVRFGGVDEHGRLLPSDERFRDELETRGIAHILRTVCGLDSDDPLEAECIDEIQAGFC